MAWKDTRTNFTRNLAVVIAVDHYENKSIRDLSTPVNDAFAIANLLETDYAYKQDDLQTQVIRLFDKQATLAGIRDLLTKTLPQLALTDGDRLIFYFAGHGLPRTNEDAPEGYLVPQDADPAKPDSFLPMREVAEELSKLACHHLLLILDCCFAGTFRWVVPSRDLIPVLKMIHREHYYRFIRYPAWQLITSSAHDQEALDVAKLNQNKRDEDKIPGYDDKLHSPFALALLEGLQHSEGVQRQNADLIPDGVVTAHELFTYLEQRVSQLSKERQTPGLYPLRRDYDKGQFIFTSPKFDPEKQLEPAPKLNEENNPYRGLKSFDEKHAQFFFGRQVLIEALVKRLCQPEQTLQVVLGVSGSGKSSLVKAGLLPRLRADEHQWYILEPMRPQAYPFTALARVLLPVVNPALIEQLTQVSFLDEKLKQVVSQPEQQVDSTTQTTASTSATTAPLYKAAQAWGTAQPEAKLLLIENYFAQLEAQCSGEEKRSLTALHQALLSEIDTTVQQLQQNRHYLSHEIQKWSQAHPNTTLLLVIDQFEELITMNQDSSTDSRKAAQTGANRPSDLKQLAFLEMLREAIAACPQQWRVVVTLRSDFEPRFLDSPLQAYWQAARFPVRAMNSDELRQAIEGPALKQALYFELDNLVGMLIDEVGQMPGALPLLSFTLSELYVKLHERWTKDESTDRALRMKDYEELSGVAGALTRRATEEYESQELDDLERATMRRVMLRMVAIEGSGVARRQVPESELVYSTTEENQRREKVINQLVNVRLLVKGQETGRTYVEPAHDFLLRWNKLQEWIEQEKEDIALQQRLTPAANDWKNNRGGLWMREEGRLVRLEQVLSSSENNWLNSLEIEFINESKQQRLLELKEAERQRDEAIRGQVDALVSLSEMRFANHDQLGALLASTKATQQLRNRYGAQAAIQAPAVLALLQSICSIREFNRLENHTDAVRVVTFSPTGEMLATAGDDKVIRLWDSNGHEYKTISEYRYPITGLCFSPDGQILASISSLDPVKLWNIETGELITEFHLRGEPTFDSVCFSPDGKWLAAGTIQNTIAAWHISIENSTISNDDLTIFVHSTSTDEEWGGIKSICFSPDSATLASASASAKDVKLWSLTKNCLLKTFSNDYERRDYMALSFSPNGQILAYADNSDTRIKLWCVEDGSLLKTLEHENRTLAVCFSHDGKTITSSDTAGIVKVWGIDGTLKQLLQGHTRGVISLSFSLDDQIIASASLDRSVKLWKLSGAYQALQAIQSDKSSNIAVSPDGQIIGIGTLENRVVICSKDGTLIKTLRVPDNEIVIKINFSSNGQIIAIVTQAHSIYLTNLDTNSGGWQLLTKLNQAVTDLSFSCTGNYMALASQDNDIYIWDVEAHKIIKKLENVHNNFAVNLKFDHEARILLSTGRNDNSVKLWSVDNDSHLSIEYGKKEGNPIELACFSSNSQVVATTHLTTDLDNSDVINVVKLWTRKGELINTLIHNRDKFRSINHIAFSLDSNLVASASTQTVRLWNIKGELLKQLIVENPPIIGICFCSSINALIGISADNVVTVWATDGTLMKTIISKKLEPRNESWNDLGTVVVSQNGQTIVGTKNQNFQNSDSSIVVWNFDLDNLLAISHQWLNIYLHSHHE